MSGAVRRDDPWWDRYFLAPRTAAPRWAGDLMLAAMGLADCRLELVQGAWWQRVSVLAATGALWLRRRHPATAFACTVPALFGAQALALSCFALCALARRSRPPGGILAAIVTVMLGYLLCWRPCLIRDGPGLGLGSAPLPDMTRHLVYALLVAGAPPVVGLHYRARMELARHVEELSVLRRQEQRLHTERAVREERARIGWEMHDVVSHTAGLIAVQAGALSVTTTDPVARGKAETLRRLAVSTLEELRTVLLVLRSDDPHPQGPVAQPRLAGLAPLVDLSGVDAHLHITSAVTGLALPDAYQRTVYRTVQECLTNVRKHAPGATATVTVATDGRRLHVTVRNTPATAAAATPLPGSGHGLLGLRERAASLGGTLTSGSSPGQGFTVHLTLPLPPR